MGEPTNGFAQREKDFEAKFLHDEELKFRIQSRRNHLFGVWAAEVLGYKGNKAEIYVQEILLIDAQKAHDEDVLHKVLKDFEEAQVDISEHRVRKRLRACWKEAHNFIMNVEGK